VNICIVGIGLIGGSLAIDLRANGFADSIIGVDNNETHCSTALQLNLVDECLPLEQALSKADLIILAVPVNAIVNLLPTILDKLHQRQILTDMGSTKKPMIEVIKNHPNRNRYVPSHPMAGTENSGPSAAIRNLFANRVAIICDKEKVDADALKTVEKMYKSLFMNLVYMESDSHDMHAAYVSHISHISSFLLANTVLAKEKSESTIFNLASGGFESTVRLAKSSPKMWADIFTQNADNVSEVLDTYINLLKEFKEKLNEKDYEYLYNEMAKANDIRRILK